MKHHISEKRQPLRRTVIYVFMTSVVAILVTIMMLILLGFTINQDEGRVEQGSLLQLASSPSGADVYIDGKDVGSKTNTKRTVSVSEHTIDFSLEKYHTWTKSINPTAGQVVWVNYARLVPTVLTPSTVKTFENVANMSVSPKRSYILMQEKIDLPKFQLVDVRLDEVKTVDVVLPENILSIPSSGSQRLSIVSWSDNEKLVLIRNNFGKQVEWLVLNRENPDESINLNKSFAINPDEVVFAGKSDQRLFISVDGVVSRINTTNESISEPLATNVDDFSSLNVDTIVYTSLPNELNVRVAGYSSVDFSKQQVIRTYNVKKRPFFVAMSMYFNKQYVAVIRDNQLVVDTGAFATPSSNPELKRIFSREIPTGVKKLTMSVNGRFALIEYADKYAVYDIELDEYHQTAWQYMAKTQRSVKWLDDYIVWSDNGGILRMYDFDGANQHDVMEVTEGFSASLGGGGKYMYGLLKTSEGFELRRVKMLL